MSDEDKEVEAFMVGGLLGVALSMFFWLGLFLSGAIDNNKTWTLSDIQGELEERRKEAAYQIARNKAELEKLEAIQ